MKLAEMGVTQFVDTLASDAPAPGGGSAAALMGALGAGLAAMVGCLTQGRKSTRTMRNSPPRWKTAGMS